MKRNPYLSAVIDYQRSIYYRRAKASFLGSGPLYVAIVTGIEGLIMRNRTPATPHHFNDAFSDAKCMPPNPINSPAYHQNAFKSGLVKFRLIYENPDIRSPCGSRAALASSGIITPLFMLFLELCPQNMAEYQGVRNQALLEFRKMYWYTCNAAGGN